MTPRRMVLLPGMDGTGKLLLEFVHAPPARIRKEIPQYLTDVVLSYDQLAKMVRSMCEDSPPFVLLAESFSTPLAIRIAAENPANLRGLILCAGFVMSPARGVTRWLALALAPLLMRAALPEAAIRSRLVGRDASRSLVTTVRARRSLPFSRPSWRHDCALCWNAMCVPICGGSRCRCCICRRSTTVWCLHGVWRKSAPCGRRFGLS
jgi:pimeloyl-ACP methyl ester carboxylesterase